MPELIEEKEKIGLEVMPSFDFSLSCDKEQELRILEHRAWLKSIKREMPLPKHHFILIGRCCRMTILKR